MPFTPINRRTMALGLAASTLPAWALAQASDWPSRPVRFVAPAPPGGSLDRLTRVLSNDFAKVFGQPFYVENRPGAGSTIGTGAVATAKADGYTLLMSGVFNAISPALYAKLPYNYLKDFVHIAPTIYGSNVRVAKADFPCNTVAELVAAATARPGTLNYASAGSGTSGHLTMEVFQRSAGIQLTHVPYKGSAPAMQDVLAGVTALIATNQDAALPQIKAGKLKALAITSAQRIQALSNVPTFAELGLQDLVITSWGALAAPTGTPAPIVEKLRAATLKALRQPDMRQTLEAEGWVLFDMAPAEFEAFVRKETERWAAVIQTAGIRLD